MVRMSNKQLALVVGIHPAKVSQGILPAYDKAARICLADPFTHYALMNEAIERVKQEIAANGIDLDITRLRA